MNHELMNKEEAFNSPTLIKLQETDKNIIAKQFDVCLEKDRLRQLHDSDLCKDFFEGIPLTDKITLSELQTYVSSLVENLTIKDIKKEFLKDSTAILIVNKVDSILHQIKNDSDVNILLQWIGYINTNKNHYHLITIDEILEKCANVTVKSMNSQKFSFFSNKSPDIIKEILDYTAKNCSQNLFVTIHNVLQGISNSKLKDEEKKELYKICINRLRDAIQYAKETNFYTPFIYGKEQLFQIIKEINENKDDFDKSHLNTIIGDLFTIYFTLIDKYDGLDNEEKQYIFNSLIPFDDTNKKDIFLNNIAEKIQRETLDNASKYFTIKILKDILSNYSTNDNAKIKCIDLMLYLYIKEENEQTEIKESIKDILDYQPNKIQEYIIKQLFTKYKNLNGKIKTDFFILLSDIILYKISVIENSNQIEEMLSIVMSCPDENRDIINKILLNFFSLETIVITENGRKKGLKYVADKFENYTDDQKQIIISVIIYMASQIKNPKDYKLFFNCWRIFYFIISNSESYDVSQKTIAITILVDIYINENKNEIGESLKSIINETNCDKSIKKAIFEALYKSYSDIRSNDSEKRSLIYHLINNQYHNNFDDIKDSSYFTQSLSIWIDNLKSGNTTECGEAKQNLIHFFKSNLQIEQKKSLLDNFESTEVYNNLSEQQKRVIFEILKELIDTDDKDLLEKIYDTVVNHFILFEFEKFKSKDNFSFKIGDNGDPVDRAKRWFRIILRTQGENEEGTEVIEFIKNLILNGKNDISFRNDFFNILKECISDKKELITLSIEILISMLRK